MENVTLTKCLIDKLYNCLQIVRIYDWLINSYMLDFYIENHWEKLPKSWQLHLENICPEELSSLLNFQCCAEQNDSNVWPLSLLALRRLLLELCMPRKQHGNIFEQKESQSPTLSHIKLKNIFNKGVKPKKRHEIEIMSSICKYSCQQSPVEFIVDFGAGLGHLARVLGYGYGTQVFCFEMRSDLNVQANIMNKHFELMAKKHLPLKMHAFFRQPKHLTLCMTPDMQPHEFLNIIIESLQIPDNNFKFGIIGLHPCGDLAVMLMRMFIHIPQARFLNFASCCYMKLTTANSKPSKVEFQGYPISQFLLQQPKQSFLSYEALEISCHAMELYCDRLSRGDYEYLKVHSFRAAAERIIVKHRPHLKHCGLRSVKHVPGMSFEEYFYKATQGMEVSNLRKSDLQTVTTKNDLLQWRRIVIFYTLRLMFAPLIESIVLYDRALYLRENGCQVDINAAFNPRLSPRNHVTCAFKLR